MNKCLFQSLLVLLSAAFAVSGNAADIEKRGRYTGKFGWYAVGKAFEIDKGHWFWVGEFSGTFFSDRKGGFMDLHSVVCPGVNDIAPDGMTLANGYCIVSDMADNKAFLVWKCQGKMGDKCNGDFQWTGGTGKYGGIKGNNRFFGMTLVPSNSGYSEWDGGWELQ